jgi:hypothetical protein
METKNAPIEGKWQISTPDHPNLGAFVFQDPYKADHVEGTYFYLSNGNRIDGIVKGTLHVVSGAHGQHFEIHGRWHVPHQGQSASGDAKFVLERHRDHFTVTWNKDQEPDVWYTWEARRVSE